MTKWWPNWQHPPPTQHVLYYLLLSITLVHTAPTTRIQADGEEDTRFIKGQLEKYGYLRSHSTETQFREALRNFQELLEVEQTGIVDEQTVQAASRPRCVHSDVKQQKGSRTKRFSLSKQAKWDKRHFNSQGALVLKWHISDYSNDIDRVETRKVVKKAFELWSSQSIIKNEKKVTLLFSEAQSKADADINILWAEGDHGDDYDFDGATGKRDAMNRNENVLAHTFFPGYTEPLNGDIHFDDAETWEIDVNNVIQGKTRFFPYVLAHEIGHTLGLSHSRKGEALMYPFYKSVPLDEITLDIDDKCGVLWNLVPGGNSNFCLYVWLMSEIVETHNGSVNSNNPVGPMSSKPGRKNYLSHTKIPKCSSNNSYIRTLAEEMLQKNLLLSESMAKKYTEVVCNFLAGLHIWRARPNYSPNESTEKEYKGVRDEMNAFTGSISVKRFLRHAEALKRKQHPPTPFDPEYFDDDFFENFFMEYLN